MPELWLSRDYGPSGWGVDLWNCEPFLRNGRFVASGDISGAIVEFERFHHQFPLVSGFDLQPGQKMRLVADPPITCEQKAS